MTKFFMPRCEPNKICMLANSSVHNLQQSVNIESKIPSSYKGLGGRKEEKKTLHNENTTKTSMSCAGNS